MKNVIVTMPMKDRLYSFKYPVKGNSTIEYDGEVVFGVNGVLARILESNEKIKLIFIVTSGGIKKGKKNALLFREEFDKVNKGKNLDVTEKIIEINNHPVKNEYEKLTAGLIKTIDDDAEIIADFTFGNKVFPFILMCSIKYAEMFKRAELLCLTYSKLEWDAENNPYNPMLYDITASYYLQQLIGAMEGQEPETARKMLSDFFVL